MNEEQVRQQIEQGPGSTCAFLPARFRLSALGETLVALANTHGGAILLGVRARRRSPVEGLVSANEASALVEQAAQACVPPLELPAAQPVTINGRTLLVVTVPAGLPHAYHYQGVFMLRAGEQNIIPSSGELRSLLLERGEDRFEALVPDGATLDDLDPQRLREYAALLQAIPDAPLPLLEQRGALVATPDGPRPTYAALLLFGRDPQAFMPHARIVLAHYTGDDAQSAASRQETSGTLPQQVRQAEDFLQAHMRRGRMYAEEGRIEVTEYPLEAIHEALVNAVMHRDYSLRGQQIRVEKYQDRIEVHSPGRLPGSVSLANLPGACLARNPIVAQVLADMGLAARLGHGLKRIVALMEAAGLPRPALREERATFQLTLPGPGGMPLGDLPADPQALARLGLNERQVQAMLYLAEQGRLSGRDLQELCPTVSPETLRRDLADLVARSLLLKVGERRATYYILK